MAGALDRFWPRAISALAPFAWGLALSRRRRFLRPIVAVSECRPLQVLRARANDIGGSQYGHFFRDSCLNLHVVQAGLGMWRGSGILCGLCRRIRILGGQWRELQFRRTILSRSHAWLPCMHSAGYRACAMAGPPSGPACCLGGAPIRADCCSEARDHAIGRHRHGRRAVAQSDPVKGAACFKRCRMGRGCGAADDRFLRLFFGARALQGRPCVRRPGMDQRCGDDSIHERIHPGFLSGIRSPAGEFAQPCDRCARWGPADRRIRRIRRVHGPGRPAVGPGPGGMHSFGGTGLDCPG